MRNVRILTVAILAFAFLHSASAQQRPVRRLDVTTISPAEIDATVTRLMKAGEVTGLGLAIINDGRIVYLKGYGFSDTETKRPFTTSSVVSGASFTKVAFGYMVLQLADAKSDRP
jgi:CubicO group peptidase (beta-lactamase class C family)